MCAGGDSGPRMERPRSMARFESYADPAFGSEDELSALRRQNANLLRQQQCHERSLKELRSQLMQQHEEEIAQRVARHTHETASLVTRQEEHVQRLVMRYEQQLAQVEESSNRHELEQLRRELSHMRRALAERQSQAGDARASFEAYDAAASKQKRKIQRLQAQRAEEVRIMRRRLRSWMSSASNRAAKAAAFKTWRVAIVLAIVHVKPDDDKQTQAIDTATEAHVQRSMLRDMTEACHPTLLAIAAARPLLTALAVLRAWAVTVLQEKHEVVQRDQASMQNTAALHALRSDMSTLRMTANRSARSMVHVSMALQLATPFAVWARTAALNRHQHEKRGTGAGLVLKVQMHMTLVSALHCWASAAKEMRHEALLRGHLDEASTHSMAAIAALRADVRDLRARRKRVALSALDLRSVKVLAAPFAAWSREMIQMRAQRRHTGEVVLNSGEAARRVTKQLEETRAQCAAQLAQAQREASDAQLAVAAGCQRERRAVVATSRAHDLAHQWQNWSLLQLMLQSWRGSRHKPLTDVEVQCETEAEPPSAGRGDQRAAAFIRHLASVVHPEQESTLLYLTFKLWNLAAISTREVIRAEAEPTRRYLAEMQAMRTDFDTKVAALKKKNSDTQKTAVGAIRKEARLKAIMERSKRMLFQERGYSELLALFYAWITASAELRFEERLSTKLSEAEQRHEQALACLRNESRSALKTAWSNNVEAARHAAALDRRKAAEALLAEETRTNWAADSGERPTTAAAIERQLEMADEEARRKAGLLPPPVAPGYQILEIADDSFCSREQRRNVIESMVRRQEAQWLSEPFEVWRRVALETKHMWQLYEANARANKVKESRKGLFIAALGQQVKYWQASAFATWKQAQIEARSLRVVSKSGQRRPKSTGHGFA